MPTGRLLSAFPAFAPFGRDPEEYIGIAESLPDLSKLVLSAGGEIGLDSLLQLLGMLLLVLGVFGAFAWAVKRWKLLPQLRGGQSHLQILEVRSLGQRNSLFVVEYRGRRLLIGSGNNGPRLLSALPDDGPHETSKGKGEDSEIDVVLETNTKGSGASFLSELNHHIGREGV